MAVCSDTNLGVWYQKLPLRHFLPDLVLMKRFTVNGVSFHLRVCLQGTNKQGAYLSRRHFYCTLKTQWACGYLKRCHSFI